MRLALICAATVLAGCGVGPSETLPKGITTADVAQFKTAVTDAGCAITDPDLADRVETQTGFDDDKLTLILQYLTLAGESEPAAAGFRLTSGPCANA